MKTGFAERKKGLPKEDRAKSSDADPKGLLAGLALTGVLLGSLAAASRKAADHFAKDR